MKPQEQTTRVDHLFSARIFLVASSLFFVAAICLHHNFNPATLVRDVVVYPAVVFVVAALWKKRRWLYAVAAVVIALPSFAFLDHVSSLSRPGQVRPFLNQLLLLLAGICAVLAGISTFRKKRA